MGMRGNQLMLQNAYRFNVCTLLDIDCDDHREWES